jgi:hypothetical protein
MTLSFSEVFPMLANAVPGFEASDEDWAEPLAYCFLNEMVRFVSDRTFAKPTIEAERFGDLLERLIAQGDDEVQYLVIDAIEGLVDLGSKEIVASHFGPQARKRWEIVSGEIAYPEDVPRDWAKFPK